MPISFHIDTGRRLVLTHAQGDLTFAQVLGYYRDLRMHMNFKPSYSELVDFREVAGAGITNDEIGHLAKMTVFDPAARRALVAESAFMFGLCRMFCAYSEFERQHLIGVFQGMREAQKWLGLKAEPGDESVKIAS